MNWRCGMTETKLRLRIGQGAVNPGGQAFVVKRFSKGDR